MSNRESSQSQSQDNLTITQTGAIATISINRARLLNTLSIATIHNLTEQFSYYSQDPTISVIILRGLGEAFAAGADINELLTLSPTSAVDFSILGGRLFNTMRQSPALIIAAIDGFCMGGGLDLALACDLRYATPTSIFAHPGAKIGIITGFGGTRRLPKAIGRVWSETLFATAERLDGTEAFQIGLIQALVNDSSAIEYAHKQAEIFAKHSRDMIRDIKTLVRLADEPSNPRADLLMQRYGQLMRAKKR